MGFVQLSFSGDNHGPGDIAIKFSCGGVAGGLEFCGGGFVVAAQLAFQVDLQPDFDVFLQACEFAERGPVFAESSGFAQLFLQQDVCEHTVVHGVADFVEDFDGSIAVEDKGGFRVVTEEAAGGGGVDQSESAGVPGEQVEFAHEFVDAFAFGTFGVAKLISEDAEGGFLGIAAIIGDAEAGEDGFVDVLDGFGVGHFAELIAKQRLEAFDDGGFMAQDERGGLDRFVKLPAAFVDVFDCEVGTCLDTDGGNLAGTIVEACVPGL